MKHKMHENKCKWLDDYWTNENKRRDCKAYSLHGITEEYLIVFNPADGYTPASAHGIANTLRPRQPWNLQKIYYGFNGEFTSTDTTSVSVCVPIAAPILHSVNPDQVATLLKERERCEIELESKNLQISSLCALPYSAIIDRTVPKNIFFIGKLDNIAENVTNASNLWNEHIKTCMKSPVIRSSPDRINPSII